MHSTRKKIVSRILSSACLAAAMFTGTHRTVAESAPEKLVLTGENTVIIARDTYQPAWLQYYLIRCVAKHPDFMNYAPGSKGDRFKAPVFPLAREIPEGKNAIVVGTARTLRGNYLTETDFELLEAKRGTVLLRRQGNTVILCRTAKTSPWDMNAIRIFLDKCAGVRLYAPTLQATSEDELWLSEPESAQIVIDELDIVRKPFFARTAFSNGGVMRNQEWMRMNSMVSDGIDMRASHTIVSYFAPDKWYEKHPQLFPMGADGNRPKPIGNYWNPCLADPELAAQVAMESVRERLSPTDAEGKPRRVPEYLSFGVMDTQYSCQCPVCQESMKKHNGSAAEVWYEFLNIVARQCREEFPELYLTSYDYSNVRIRDGMNLRIEPNIVLTIVIKSYLVANEAAYNDIKQRALTIAATGAGWQVHDWNFSGVTPRIYSRQEAALLQWGAQNNMVGIYTEWSAWEAWYLEGAKYWVLRQLKSDPYVDVDTLWRQYCQDMFGAAHEEMYRFFDMFAMKHIMADKYCQVMDWPRQEAAAFTPEDIALQRQYLDRALEITRKEPLIQRRLEAIMRYFRAHELLALATGEPARMYHRHTVLEKNSGINTEALTFYLNDDAKGLLEFDEYYDTQRTLPPNEQTEDNMSGIRFNYRNNYSRALGTIIETIKNIATEGMDMSAVNAEGVRAMTARARTVLRENLPAAYDEKRAGELEKLLTQIVFIPKLEEMPVFDGKLDEKVWAKAARLDNWTIADLMIPSVEGNHTEGRVMRVGNHIVFGIVCTQPIGIWAETPADRFTGTSIWREAGCEFFFGPAPSADEKPEYFQYIVNALGSFRGFQSARDNRKDVHAAVHLDEANSTYTIEVAFPLQVEGMYDYSQGQAFSFNIMRNCFAGKTFNPKERIGWHPLFFTAHRPESRGLVFMEK